MWASGPSKKPTFFLFPEFFPCVRFEAQVLLNFRGENSGYKDWSLRKKLSNDLKLHNELNRNYELITKLCIIF